MHEEEAAGLPGGSRRARRQQTPEVVLPAAPPVEQPRTARRRGAIWAVLAGTALVLAGVFSIWSGFVGPERPEIAAAGSLPAETPDASDEGASGEAGTTPSPEPCPALGGESSAAALLCAESDADDSRPSSTDDRDTAESPRDGSDDEAPVGGPSEPGTDEPDPRPSDPGSDDPAPGDSDPGDSGPGDSDPSDPPVDPKPSDPPSDPEPPVVEPPAPLKFTGLERHGLLVLLTSYTLSLSGEPGSTATITYGSSNAGTVTFSSSGTASITIGRSLVNLGLSNPTITAAYSDGTEGDPISARRDSI